MRPELPLWIARIRRQRANSRRSAGRQGNHSASLWGALRVAGCLVVVERSDLRRGEHPVPELPFIARGDPRKAEMPMGGKIEESASSPEPGPSDRQGHPHRRRDGNTDPPQPADLSRILALTGSPAISPDYTASPGREVTAPPVPPGPARRSALRSRARGPPGRTTGGAAPARGLQPNLQGQLRPRPLKRHQHAAQEIGQALPRHLSPQRIPPDPRRGKAEAEAAMGGASDDAAFPRRGSPPRTGGTAPPPAWDGSGKAPAPIPPAGAAMKASRKTGSAGNADPRSAQSRW